MGNSQGNQSDNNRAASDKQRKVSTVRGRVLARFKSKNSLQTKDNAPETFNVVKCDNDFPNMQTEKPDDVHETVAIHSLDNVDKRISQISQSADSAKDALDFANQKPLESEPTSNVPFEEIYEIKTSAAKASSTLPMRPTTLTKPFRIPNELHGTTSENTKTVTSSPADVHGLNQTTTTQTNAAAQRVPSKELWESTNVSKNNGSVPNDIAVVAHSTLIDDKIVDNEKWCGDDNKINKNKCETNDFSCKNNKNIVFSTRSWNIARRINCLFRWGKSETEITNKLTPTTTDVIVLREQTTSSSSDSIFTDPLTTPIGFSTEINQCYYSEDNVCDTSDVDKLDQLAGETVLPSHSCTRKTKSYLDILNKLSKLSLTNVDCYNTTLPNYCSDETVASTSEADAIISMVGNMKISNTISPSPNYENGTDKMSIFNIALVKKVDLPTLVKVRDDSEKTVTTNEAELMPTTILQQQQQPISQRQPTPSSILVQQQHPLAPVCPSTSHGNGNVLKKVASFTVERTNSDNTASKISRPSYVPEKLNFNAYEKFEGQMLINWMSSSSSQLLYNGSDISQLIQHYCTNLLVAGVIKQIADEYAPIQETFRSNLMYEWTHAPKSIDTRTNFYNSTLRGSPAYNNLRKSFSCNTLNQNADTTYVNLIQNRLKIAKSNFLECQMDAMSMHMIGEVFEDLESICSEILTVQKKLLSQKVLMNEKDSLYVSCINNESMGNPSAFENEAVINQKHNSTVDTIIENLQNESVENYERNVCDKIEICKYCGNTNSMEEDSVAPVRCSVNVVKREEKETQTNEVDMKIDTKTATNGSVPSSDKNVNSSSCFEAQSVPVPPPMPVSHSILTAIKTPTIPPPPPPLPMQSFPINSTMTPVAVSKTLQSMPPPIPPPFPGVKSKTLSNTTTPISSIPLPPQLPPPVTSTQSSDTVDGVESPSSNGLNGLVVPSSSKTFSLTPLPMPEAGNTWFQANTLRKNALKPSKPMKPLYWTRIVAPPTPQSDVQVNTPEEEGQLWKEIDETTLDNLDEFTEMFSRAIIEPKKAKEKTHKPAKVKTIKILDSKRSQSVGIFSRSLHVNFDEIEHAIYHCDTSVVSLEALQTLMEIKATPEELESIKAAAAQDDAPLDPPDLFLLKISNFSCSAERISCIVFRSDFEEGSLSVTKKLNTVINLCEVLMESEDLKSLFSIILTLGNYMNGGNRQRGQADGFGLEILGKLKDVKSKDPRVTLLHFIVKTYICRCRSAGTPLNDIVLPIPDPIDIVKAVVIDFKEVEDQVNSLTSKLKECHKVTDIVITNSTETTLQPFKDQMESFHDRAEQRIQKLTKKLADSKQIFLKTLQFYKFLPKSGPLTDVTPGQFFEYWAPFTNDFRDIWKKEMTILNNEIMQKGRALYNKNLIRVAERKVTPTQPGSLKERMLRLRKQQNEKLSKN